MKRLLWKVNDDDWRKRANEKNLEKWRKNGNCFNNCKPQANEVILLYDYYVVFRFWSPSSSHHRLPSHSTESIAVYLSLFLSSVEHMTFFHVNYYLLLCFFRFTFFVFYALISFENWTRKTKAKLLASKMYETKAEKNVEAFISQQEISQHVRVDTCERKTWLNESSVSISSGKKLSIFGLRLFCLFHDTFTTINCVSI